jgi:hypothetical protein
MENEINVILLAGFRLVHRFLLGAQRGREDGLLDLHFELQAGKRETHG